MKFGVVKPRHRSHVTTDVADLADALRQAELTPGSIDHGTITLPNPPRAGLAIIVSDLGLFVPPAAQSFFALRRKLFAGPAVLYGFDICGQTVDVPPLDPLRIMWLRDGDAVEVAIAIGAVIRPVMGSGRDIIWRWPEPRPTPTERDDLIKRVVAAAAASGEPVTFDDDTTLIVERDENPESCPEPSSKPEGGENA
jgi:hypothetical protein